MVQVDVGAEALFVVARLVVAHPLINKIKLIRYELVPTFNEILQTTELTEASALKRRLLHGGKKVQEQYLDRGKVTPTVLNSFINNLSDNSAVAIASTVEVESGAILHFPLLDFQCQRSPENLTYLKMVMKYVHPAGGILLESDHSYHFYGTSLLQPDDWIRFVGKSLLLEPLVDVRYLGHCLLDGFAALRISGRQDRSMGAPRVVVNVN